MQLELLCKAIGAESAQLIYAVSISERELAFTIGPGSLHFTNESPYKNFEKFRSNLPRRRSFGDMQLFESMEFGGMGSASTLRLIMRQPEMAENYQAFSDNLIVEHCKRHETLDKNYETEVQECQLTDLEKMVLLLSAQGLTAKEIATEIGKKDRAVEYLFKKAKDKLGVATVQEATFRAGHLLRM